MCGITGIVLPDGQRPDAAVLTRMTDRLAHRGPDSDGIYLTAGCGFGHRRLSIVDLSPLGAQPMRTDDDAHVLTFNGEIYDFKALRYELTQLGEHLRSRSDTEALLLALRRWGVGALSRVQGMFAFGHWNALTRTLLLARDRFGKKPLYYAPLGDATGREGLAFASELRALLGHPRVRDERRIDPVAVSQYLMHECVPAPRSVLANVRKLGAGECLTWSAERGLSVEAYYRPVFSTRLRGDEQALTEEFVRRVERAVARRLVADVPVGVFLSGGLDSSLIAALAVRSHPTVKTFAIGFEDPSFDERAHAELVARHLGTVHRTEVLSSQAMLDLVPSTLDWIDEPHADSSILPTTMLARVARREVTVALGGDGGDEILAGYPTFIVDQFTSRLPHDLAAVRGLSWALKGASRFAPRSDANFSLGFKLQQMAQGLDAHGAERHARWLSPFDLDALASVAGPHLTGSLAQCLNAAVHAAEGCVSEFDRATAFYLRLYLAEGVLQKVDRATMRVSLEARAPLLDTEVVEFALALPPSLRVRGNSTKYLMRKALRAMVPRSILDRPKKGFGAPVGQWLRGPLRELLCDTLRRDRLIQGGWFDPDVVERMIQSHLSGRADLRKPLYTLLVFEHWRARWMEGPAGDVS